MHNYTRVGMKFISFIVLLVREIRKSDIPLMAAHLTYRMLMAFFPFVLFFLSLLGFLQIDTNAVLEGMRQAIPEDIMVVVDNYVIEVFKTRNPGLLSVSLAVALYNASAGFRVFILCINRANKRTDQRRWHRRVLLGALMVLLLITAVVAAVVLSGIAWAFGLVCLWLCWGFYSRC